MIRAARVQDRNTALNATGLMPSPAILIGDNMYIVKKVIGGKFAVINTATSAGHSFWDTYVGACGVCNDLNRWLKR